MIVERNKQFSVVCHSRVAPDCSENGGWCDSEEEANEWVEDECWIFTGDDWMCINCNAHHMRHLKVHRRGVHEKNDKGKANDGLDHELTIGIDPL
jgi:hypothetical protein